MKSLFKKNTGLKDLEHYQTPLSIFSWECFEIAATKVLKKWRKYVVELSFSKTTLQNQIIFWKWSQRNRCSKRTLWIPFSFYESFLCTRKACFFQISLTLKAGFLPFYNLLHYYDLMNFQKLVLCQKFLMYLEVFLWTELKTKSFWYDLKEKMSEISKFLIWPYTQDRKLGNLRNFVYLEI